MKKVGNVTSNTIYNPQGKKPSVPIDADEADSAMERFIRSKYMNSSAGLTAARRHDTGSTGSDETPPPLPPKTPSRFGFRSASSIFPLSSKAKRDAASRPPPSPRELSGRSPSSPRRNKPSKVFGATVQYDAGDDTELKMAKLRDMGFMDDQRNGIILKGVNGNLERAIEALVRLGEGGSRSPMSLVSPRESSLSATRSLTPATTVSGASLSTKPRPTSPSLNPFDALDMPPAQPQSSQSTGTLQTKNPFNTNPYPATNNPFGAPASQSEAAFNQAFQGMSLAATQQPLFPHHTGGIPAPQPSAQPLYQQSMTPPIPSASQNYLPLGFNSNQTYPPPVQPAPASLNPFLNMTSPVQQAPLSVNTVSVGGFGSNPFTRSPTRIQSPTLNQIPEQAQQNVYSQWNSPASAIPQQPQQPQQLAQMFASPLQQQPTNNPFLSPAASAHTPSLPQQQQQQQLQQMMQQPIYEAARPDKAAIMALYGMPQLAPQSVQAQPQLGQDTAAAIFGQPVQANSTVAVASPDQPRSLSSPLPGSKNPFKSHVSTPTQAPLVQPSAMDAMVGHRSRDSIMALGMEWSNGRHSPDAFASLSARH